MLYFAMKTLILTTASRKFYLVCWLIYKREGKKKKERETKNYFHKWKRGKAQKEKENKNKNWIEYLNRWSKYLDYKENK